MRRLAAAGAILLALGLAGGGVAGAAPVSLDGYTQELRMTLDEIDRALAELHERPDEARSLLTRLGARVPREEVRLPGGPSLRPDNAWLAEGLASAAAALPDEAAWDDLFVLRDGLASLVEEMDAMRAPGYAGGADRELLESILARPEFSSAHALTWLERWLDRFLRNLDTPGSPSRGAGMGVGVAALGLLLAFLVISIRRQVVADIRQQLPREARQRPGASTWREQADDAARRGDFRGAIRSLYLDVLERLQRAGVVEADPARTNWELVRSAEQKGAGLHPAFMQLTAGFERAWYGPAPAGPDDYRSFLGLWEQVAGGVRP